MNRNYLRCDTIYCYFFLGAELSRCWAYETGVLLGKEIEEEIPYNDYFEYYAPDFKLHLTPVKERACVLAHEQSKKRNETGFRWKTDVRLLRD